MIPYMISYLRLLTIQGLESTYGLCKLFDYLQL